MNTSHKNCAAPYDPALNKCPYCGTSYYDMSGIDFTDHEPFYLKIKTVINGQPCYITQLVRPSLSSMEMHSDTVDVIGGLGNNVMSFTSSQSLTTNINFEAIPDKAGNLMRIQV